MARLCHSRPRLLTSTRTPTPHLTGRLPTSPAAVVAVHAARRPLRAGRTPRPRRPRRQSLARILPRSGCRTRPRHQRSGSRQKSGRGGRGREAAAAAADDDEGLRSSAIFRYYSFFCLTVPQRQPQPTTTRAEALDHCRLSANAMPTTRRSGPADPSHFDPQGASPRRRRGVP